MKCANRQCRNERMEGYSKCQRCTQHNWRWTQEQRHPISFAMAEDIRRKRGLVGLAYTVMYGELKRQFRGQDARRIRQRLKFKEQMCESE